MLVFADSPLLMKILLSGKLILNGGTKGGFSTKSLSSGRGVIIIPNEIKNIRIEPKKIKSNIPFFSFGKSHPPNKYVTNYYSIYRTRKEFLSVFRMVHFS